MHNRPLISNLCNSRASCITCQISCCSCVSRFHNLVCDDRIITPADVCGTTACTCMGTSQAHERPSPAIITAGRVITFCYATCRTYISINLLIPFQIYIYIRVSTKPIIISVWRSPQFESIGTVSRCDEGVTTSYEFELCGVIYGVKLLTRTVPVLVAASPTRKRPADYRSPVIILLIRLIRFQCLYEHVHRSCRDFRNILSSVHYILPQLSDLHRLAL